MTIAGYYQTRVWVWLNDCFGSEIAENKGERNCRFLEEALELVQANGLGKDVAHDLVEYVYGRETGEINQEVGGVMVCLSALCSEAKIDMDEAAYIELQRIMKKKDEIRNKQAAKPDGIRG